MYRTGFNFLALSECRQKSLQLMGGGFGDRFANLDKTAVQAVVTAQVEGSVTNARMQEITGELQTLVRDGLLTQQNQRRWASYRVAGDSPQFGVDSPQFDRLAGLSAEVLALLPLAEPARKNKKLAVPQLKIVIRRIGQLHLLEISAKRRRLHVDQTQC